MKIKDLAGSVKAAILIQSLDSRSAEIMLDSIEGTDKVLIKKLMSQLGQVSQDLTEKISIEFIEKANNLKKSSAEDSKSKKNDEEDDEVKENKTNFEILKSLPSERISLLIKDEHPQTIALIIVHLQPHKAGEVLDLMPDEIKTDIAIRIANLDTVLSGMVDEIEDVIGDILKQGESSGVKQLGGISYLADLLNQIGGASGPLIMDEIEEENSELAEQIKQLMFVFDDVVLVDDRGLQQVLRSVETSELALALKASSDEVKEKMYNNMSERARDILKEEIEALGAVRMKDVANAQEKITRIIQDKEAKNEIIISGRGGDDFIG